MLNGRHQSADRTCNRSDAERRSEVSVARRRPAWQPKIKGHSLRRTVLCSDVVTVTMAMYLTFSLSVRQYIYWWPSIGLAVLCFYSKAGFWPSYCQISTDLDKILHTSIVVRNTLVGRLRPRSARGRLQALLCFL